MHCDLLLNFQSLPFLGSGFSKNPFALTKSTDFHSELARGPVARFHTLLLQVMLSFDQLQLPAMSRYSSY